MEDLAVKVAELEARAKSNTKRIDDMERRQDNMDKLIASVDVMANEIGHIKTDMTEMKTDVKAIKTKPEKRWENIVDTVIKLIVGGAVGYILTHWGL